MLNKILEHKMISKLNDKFNILVVSVGIIAVALMLCQFFMRHGFWGDEISLADSFMTLDFKGLTQKLHFGQVAPLGLLFWERAVWLLAENSAYIEYWWRIYPFLCGLGIVVMYYPLAYRLSESKVIALFAYLFLTLMPTFIYYTSEVKQYIGELFCAVLLLYFWSKTGEKWGWKRVLTMIAVIAFGVFNSLTMCFVLLPLGLWDGFELLKNARYRIKSMFKSKEFWLYALQYGTALAFLAGYYFAFLYNHPNRFYMERYWKETFATGSNIWMLFQKNFHFFYWNLPNYIMLFLIPGLLCLKNKFPFFFAFVIMLTHTVFSALKLYPLSERLVLYWLTFVPIAMACLWYFPYHFISRLSEKRGYTVKYRKLALFIGIATIIGVQVNQPLRLPIYLNSSYLKDAFIYINQYNRKSDIVFTERFNIISPYLNKYYYHYVGRKNIFTIHMRDTADKENAQKIGNIWNDGWKLFLELALLERMPKYPNQRFWIILERDRQAEIEAEIKRIINTSAPFVWLRSCTTMEAGNTVCLLEKTILKHNYDEMITAK